MAERFLIQCGDHWENQCRILPLALELRRRGWEPVVMTYDSSQGALFVAEGIAVCPLDLPGRRGGRGYRVIDGARSMLRGVGGAMSAEFREVYRVESTRNKNAYSTLTKRRQRRRAIVRHRAVLAALLDEIRPSGIAVWNGLTGIVANLLRLMAASRGLTTLFLERGFLPDSVFIDPEGTNGLASLHRLDHLPELRPESASLPQPESSDAAQLLRRYDLEPARTLFLPLQVQADTNILFHSDRIDRMSELVQQVADAAPEGTTVIVRPHPEENDAKLSLPEHPKVRYTTDGTVEGWCDAARLTVTVNSTVGLTALLRGRPVLCLGRAIYSGKGLTTDAGSRDLGPLLAAPSLPPSVTAVERFYALLVDRHLVVAGGANLGVPDPPSGGLSGPPEVELRTVRSHGQYSTADAERLSAVWQRRLENGRLRLKGLGGRVGVWARLRRQDHRNLTYRRTRVELTREELLAGVAELLRVEASDVALSTEGIPDAATLNVIVQPQNNHAVIPAGVDLVVDQYLQPHLGWLSEETGERAGGKGVSTTRRA